MLDERLDINQRHFMWGRSDRGYYWDREAVPFDGSKPEAPYLVEKPESTHLAKVDLENEPMLFVEFANLKTTEESILAFADKYGMLTGDEIDLTTPVYSDIPGSKPWKHGIVREYEGFGVVRGESLGLWQQEIQYIQWATWLLEWITECNLPALEKVIFWRDGDAVECVLPIDLEKKKLLKTASARKTVELGEASKAEFAFIHNLVISRDRNPDLFKRFRKGDLLLPAQFLMQRLINNKLNQLKIKPALLMDEGDRLFPFFVPVRLLDALWFQLFTVAGGDYKRCPECNLWEDMSSHRKSWTMHPECYDRRRKREKRQSQKL